MSTRDKRQMRNRPTRIKILQFCNNRSTSQLTAHSNVETETINNCPPCFESKVLQLCTDLYSVLQLHIEIKAQMLLTVIVPIPKCWVARSDTTKKIDHHFIQGTFWLLFPQIRQIEVFDITNPRYQLQLCTVLVY